MKIKSDNKNYSDIPLKSIHGDSLFVDALRTLSFYHLQNQKQLVINDFYSNLLSQFISIMNNFSKCEEKDKNHNITLFGKNVIGQTVEDFSKQFTKEQKQRFFEELPLIIERPTRKSNGSFLKATLSNFIMSQVTKEENGHWKWICVLYNDDNELIWKDDFIKNYKDNLKFKM